MRALAPAGERGHGFVLEAAGEVVEDPGCTPSLTGTARFVGGEDLLAFDDLAVRRDAPVRRHIPRDHAAELADIPVSVRFRQAQHGGVVDAVVALVERPAGTWARTIP